MLSRLLTVVWLGLALPTFAARIELFRAAECGGALRFSVATDAEERTVEVVPGQSTLEVPPSAVRLLEPRHCWMEPLTVAADGDQQTVRIWPAKSVRASIAKSNETMPVRVSISFRPPEEESRPAIVETAEVDADGSFELRLPAAPLDLRIAADRFAPWYLWDFDPRDPRPLRPFRLERGASVTGWVIAPSKIDFKTAAVRLVPAGSGWDSPDHPDRALRTRTVRPDQRGFFQITGIPDGAYSLVAEAARLSPSRIEPLELRDDAEQALRSPLELRLFGTLSVAISPPIGFDGKPWSLELLRFVPLAQFTKKIADAEASMGGQWSASELEAGTYVVRVRAGETTAGRREVEIDGEAVHVDVAISAVPISGTVTIGRKPLAATLTWFTPDGARTTVTSDEEGAFEGILPSDGRWYVDVKDGAVEYLRGSRIEIEKSDDGRAESIDIRIPGGTVRGKVVDANGRPVKAAVFLHRGTRILRDATVNGDGTFDFAGIEAGAVEVRAESPTAMSGFVPVMVSELDEAEVTIVVSAVRKVQGWLTTASGSPLAGARIWYSAPSLSQTPASTGPSGQFTLNTPADLPVVTLAIVAAGRAAKLVTAALPPDGERLHVALSGQSSRIRIRSHSTPPWPYVFSRGSSASLLSLLEQPVPGMEPAWLDREIGLRVDVEPGEYDFCDSAMRNRCVTVVAAPGATTIIDLRELWSRGQ